MFKFKKFIVFVCALLMASIGGAFLSNIGSSKKSGAITVGLQAGFPPYESIDNQGNVVGFDVDVAYQIGKILGKPVVFEQMGFDGLIMALKQKKIDVIISGMSITPSREKEINMVPYYGDGADNLELLFWKKIPQNIHSLKDLSGDTVTVQSGTWYASYLESFPSIQGKELENTQDLIMDIQYGKSAAALIDSSQAHDLIKKFPELKGVQIALPKNSQFKGNGIGISKKNPELTKEIQNAVNQLKQDGQMKQMADKWFGGAS